MRVTRQGETDSRRQDLNEVVLAFGFAPQTLRVWQFEPE
jgi:hypothetical protein